MQLVAPFFVIIFITVQSDCTIFEPKAEVEAGRLHLELDKRGNKLLERSPEIGHVHRGVQGKDAAIHFLGSFNRKSFYLEREGKTWTSAKSLCENIGMRLARIDTEEEKSFLDSKLSNTDTFVWLGGKENYKQDWPKMYWVDSGTAVPAQSTWIYSPPAENALVFEKQPSGRKFAIYAQNLLFYPLCYFTS